MKPSRRINFRQPGLWLCFLLPFAGYLLVMIASGHHPFGHSSILYSDMYHQYYPFFVEFHRTLRAGDSLLYNWNLGMGIDYLGLIAYYLASPLNLLSILLPESWLLGFFSLLVPVKLGLAGLFFGLFLRKVYQAQGWHLPLFSSCYALCAWALGYQWNIMWLDTFALLPLVVLGMVSLLQRRQFLLYTCTLFLSIVSNYYIGFFTCIFVALSFLVYEICYCRSFRRFWSDVGFMLLFSALAIAMTAFLELPAYVALGNTYSSVNRFPTGFSLNIAGSNTFLGLLDAMRQVAGNTAGGLEPTFKEGLPNLYCGILPMMLAIQFFTTKKFTLREKLCSLALLLFFMVSFIIRQLDYIWHGFHFTNMIPYRFSFLFSFVLLVMAYRAYCLQDTCPRWRAIVSAVVFLALAACSDKRTDALFVAYNAGFCALYTLLMCLKRRPRRELLETEDGPTVQIHPLEPADLRQNRRLSLGILGVLAVELICALVNFGCYFGGTNITHYPKGGADSQAAVAYMHQQDDGFYRAEVTHTQSLNDGALLGYSGITIFSSSANESVTKFMAALGYAAKPSYNRYAYEDASPISNLFLNLKYLIDREGSPLESDIFQPIFTSGSVTLLENTAYLPMGFLTDDTILELSSTGPTAGSLAFQNELFAAATGEAQPVLHMLADPELSASDSVSLTPYQTGSACSYSSDESGTVTYTYHVPSDGTVLVNISASKRNSFTAYKNGEKLFTETMSLDEMFRLGNCQPGDTLELTFQCKASESGRLDVSAAQLNNTVFQSGLQTLRSCTMEIQSVSGTRLTGTVDATHDGLLYTSIPDDGNWVVTVDGNPVTPERVLGVMLGIRLDKGSHIVTFRYCNHAFQVGCVVSGAALALLILLTLLVYLPRQRGKFQHKRS